MRTRLMLRIGLVVAVTGVAALLLVLLDRRGDDASSETPGITVSAITPGTSTQGAAVLGPGGPGAPGPTDGVEGASTPVAPSGPRGGVQVPDVLLAFRAMLAQASDGDPAFVYRAAVQARDAGRYALAADLFQKVAASADELAPFAELRAAQMLALEHGPAAAADAFAALLAPGGSVEVLPTSVHLVALFEAATAFEEAGRIGDSLEVLRQVPDLTSNTFQVAQSFAEQARLLEEQGDPLWVDEAVRAMEAQPGSTAARDALDLLDEVGAWYPQLTAAYVAYRAYRNDDAASRYQGLLDGGTLNAGEAGQAWFYLGALRERFFDRDGALEAYSRSLLVAPDGPLADDARYWRGRVMEEQGRVQDAATEYDLLAEVYPGSNFVDDSRLRAAVALGLAGDGASATARLATIAATAPSEAAAEAARWHTVLVTRFGAPPAADLSAQALDPTSVHAAFERAGDAAIGALPVSALDEWAEPIAVDLPSIEAWLGERMGPRPQTISMTDTPTTRLAWRLAAVGEATVARGLLNEAIAAHRGEPYALADLAVAAHERSLYDISLSAASSLLRGLSPHEYLAAPRALLGLAYPVPYLSEATAAAEEFGVPLLLLLALVRQESAFNPEAGSSAGAFGLMQVILPTGEAIARDLDVPAWTFADLAKPGVALRFGAYYLAVQLANFDGHYMAALSAYNGGPGNAARWLESQPFGGPDGYVYTVDFTETRAYLKHVTENYAMYRYLYAGAEAPSLPHGE